MSRRVTNPAVESNEKKCSEVDHWRDHMRRRRKSCHSPGWAQRRLGLAVVLALLVAYFIALDLQLGHVDAFIPAYGKAMFVTESITAVLQFVQFFMLPSRR
jgi:hypothetical protein